MAHAISSPKRFRAFGDELRALIGDIDKVPKRTKGARWNPLVTFVARIGVVYRDITGKRPAASYDGPLSTFSREIAEAALPDNLRNAIEGDRLNEAIKTAFRGKKPR